jgi:hypothetical protein
MRLCTMVSFASFCYLNYNQKFLRSNFFLSVYDRLDAMWFEKLKSV